MENRRSIHTALEVFVIFVQFLVKIKSFFSRLDKWEHDSIHSQTLMYLPDVAVPARLGVQLDWRTAA